MNEIKSKFNVNEQVTFGKNIATILRKFYNNVKNEWRYEIENRINKFKAIVKETELSWNLKYLLKPKW